LDFEYEHEHRFAEHESFSAHAAGVDLGWSRSGLNAMAWLPLGRG